MMLRQGLSLLSILSIVMCSNVFAADRKKLDGARVQVDLTNDFMVPDSTRLTVDDCFSISCGTNHISFRQSPGVVYDPAFSFLNKTSKPNCGYTPSSLFPNPEFTT